MKGWFFAATLLLILLDQASKWWIQWRLIPGQSVPIVPGVLYFTLSFNSGIAFGLFPQFGGAFLWVSLAIVSAVMIYYLRLSAPTGWTTAIASLLAGGALGNVLDRVRLGHVVDFIDFRVFPVFNLADTAVTCATVLWIIKHWVLFSAETPSSERDNRADC
ncbi:Lipoprotein signal peptidase [bacterium HR16]|nr:Lipoprotein signal peptidase [bacterium HR16]